MAGDITIYGDMLSKIMVDNTYLAEGLDFGYWLTRTRKNKPGQLIHTGKEIGMPEYKGSDRRSDKNRWGKMFYLSTDLSYRSTYKEVRVPNGMSFTTGYFFIEEHLRLFDATEPSAIANTDQLYGSMRSEDALLVLVALINNWFNKPCVEKENVYVVTNSIAQIIRDYTDLDGIAYRGEKNGNTSWNVALKDESKVSWSYSLLRAPNHIGHNYVKDKEFDNGYPKKVEYTKELLRLNSRYNYPKQIRSIFDYKFPEL